jgi:hypothetical protein
MQSGPLSEGLTRGRLSRMLQDLKVRVIELELDELGKLGPLG